MGNLFFLSIRKLQPPLVFLIAVFAISTAGFALIPGVDPAGNTWRPTLFEAFYLVTYTATTIGFGELPHPFTDTQRLWVVIVIYSSVVGWAYLLGSLLGLMQDKGFQHAVVTARFARAVRNLREPFFLICGLSETGLMVARALDRMGHRFVAIDADEARIAELDLGDFATDPPALAGDMTSPEILTIAGLEKRECLGVLALMPEDRANLAVAVAARLLHPGIRTIARAHTDEATAAMKTCGVGEVINPYREFAERVAVAMRAPDTHRLLLWLTGAQGGRLGPAIPAPPGHWIVCDYGRFGSEMAETLQEGGYQVTIIDPDEVTGGSYKVVRGVGSNHATLGAAEIASAEGIVCASDDDTENLAIALAARQLKRGIFVVIRQNRARNQRLFEALGAQMTMVPSEIAAHECLAILRAKHLARFLSLAQHRDNTWSAALIGRLQPIVRDDPPEFWSAILGRRDAPGVMDALSRHALRSTLADLARDPSDRERQLACMPLLLLRNGSADELPSPKTELKPGDEILFAGTERARRAMRETLLNANTAAYVFTGRAPTSLLGRLIEQRDERNRTPDRARR